jgi:hypothetical protein
VGEYTVALSNGQQPPTYLLTNWRPTGKQVETPGAGRFRLESGGHKVIADWSWYENPFVSTQPFKGLRRLNALPALHRTGVRQGEREVLT